MYDVNNHQEKLSSTDTQNRLRVHVKKTEVTRNQVKGNTDSELNCILDTNSKHALSECNAFRAKSIEERRQLLKENGVCFRCSCSKAHLKRDFKVDVKCFECGGQFHCSALHTLKRFVQSTQQHGGEDDNKRAVNIVNKCTDVCGSHIEEKYCAKIWPINVTHIDYPSTSLNAYMILDEQSNRTLVRSELLDYFDNAHHVLEQVLGPPNSPFAQRLTLGWAIIGDMYIGRNHSSDKVNFCKTYLSTDGRATVFSPCPNKLKVSESLKDSGDPKWLSTFESKDGLASNIFERTKDTVGLSIEDREFIALIEKELHTDEDGHWCSPLPFRSPRKCLPNNRSMVVQRTRSLERSLKRDPVKREHFFCIYARTSGQ